MPPNPATQPPKRFGRYEILEELGRGAMGVVYLAHDPLIGRQVALKVLRLPQELGEGEAEGFRRRFIREAQSAGILSHPHIVTVHDVLEGEDDEESSIAMEYIRGTDLKELLRGGRPLEMDLVLDVVAQIADALDYAHSRGVVHRDIKPANILLTEDGKVKITDFGIARLESSNLTQDTQLLGTPNYMAPEQIQGVQVDRRADIFSLGVLLYEMLTAHKPFAGDHLTMVTHRIVYDEFTPLGEHVAGLPPGIEAVLRRALEKNPDDRYPTAGDLAHELRRAVGAMAALNETQEVKAPGPPPETSPELSREPSPAGGPRRPLASARRWLEDKARSWFAPPGRSEPQRSRRRLVAVGAVALVAGVAFGGLLLWAVTPASTPLPMDPEHELRRQMLPMVRQGHLLLRSGESAAAAQEFRKAERLAPERLNLRTLRETAERQAEAFERMSEQERWLAQRLMAARQALEGRSYQEALEAASAVLDVVADDEARVAEAEEAAEIRRGAEEGLERLRRQRAVAAVRPREPAPPATAPASSPRPTSPAPREPAPASLSPPTLEVEFISDLPRGNLTVFLDSERLLDEDFRFVERKGLFGRGEPYRGRIYLKPTVVAEGPTVVRIQVAPRRQGALVETLETDFSRGSERRLSLFLSAAGELTASLE